MKGPSNGQGEVLRLRKQGRVRRRGKSIGESKDTRGDATWWSPESWETREPRTQATKKKNEIICKRQHSNMPNEQGTGVQTPVSPPCNQSTNIFPYLLQICLQK